mgnify:CR=1 FL=1
MKTKELHELTVDELNTKLKELSEELFAYIKENNFDDPMGQSSKSDRKNINYSNYQVLWLYSLNLRVCYIFSLNLSD